MLTWLQAEGVNTVLNEYRLMMLEHPEILAKDSDVDMVFGFLRLCYDSLYYDPELFAYHVSERIPASADTDNELLHICYFLFLMVFYQFDYADLYFILSDSAFFN